MQRALDVAGTNIDRDSASKVLIPYVYIYYISASLTYFHTCHQVAEILQSNTNLTLLIADFCDSDPTETSTVGRHAADLHFTLILQLTMHVLTIAFGIAGIL